MIKTIKLREGLEITLANDTLWVEHYQAQFGKDILNTLMPVLLGIGPLVSGLAEENGGKLDKLKEEDLLGVLGDPDRMLDIARGFGSFEYTDIMHITWAMAKAYDDNIPDHMTWQRELAGPNHESMPIAKVILPAITELMVKGVETSFWTGLTEKAKEATKDLKPKKKTQPKKK